ncbi:MAG: 2-hydroxymethylglutarate dehydrogenase [Clostridia bacterium]|nr:2-hydroxymethylglutarate dehydrogenase [Clostridia bacterium]
MKQRVGFIGLGAMGNPMCQNLIRASYPAFVFDINPEALKEVTAMGAKACSNAKEVASKSEVIITMLPTAKDVEAAVMGKEGILEGLQPDAVLIEMSTIDAGTVLELAEHVKEKGAYILDAPVTRTREAAVAGTLTIMVGGDRSVYERCLDILKTMGKEIYYCGGLGTGKIVKIINNLVVSANLTVLAESLTLGVKAGVDPDVLINVLKAGSANSFVFENHMSFFLSISNSPFIFMLGANLALIIVGYLLEGVPEALIFTLVFLPVVQKFGIEPLHFLIAIVASIGIGLFIPSAGVGLVVGARIGNISMEKKMKSFYPFLLVLLFIGQVIFNFNSSDFSFHSKLVNA